MKHEQEQHGQYEHETILPRGALSVIYGQNRVDDLQGTLKSRYAPIEPSPWRYIFGVYVGAGNYVIEFGLTRASALRLWKRLGEWLGIDPNRGDYTEFEMIPGAT